MNSFMG